MDNFFKYLNFFPMPLWLAMMFAPRHPLTERAGRSSTIFGLAALHYVLAIGVAMKADAEARAEARQRGEALPQVEVTTLNGIRALLSSRQGTLAAWAHMLALDLFAGGWIYRQARRLDAPDWVRIVSLFFTLMTGPFGLLIFLMWRGLRTEEGEGL